MELQNDQLNFSFLTTVPQVNSYTMGNIVQLTPVSFNNHNYSEYSPVNVVEQSAKLIWATPNPLQIIEFAGRTAWKSEGRITEDSAAQFVKGIMDRGHDSVIEHASASIRVVTDRGVSHEFVRHRIMSLTQSSTRYCNFFKEKFGSRITVIKPIGLEGVNLDIWEKSMTQAQAAYMDMIKNGSTAQEARAVLPTCLMTEIVATCNFREWRHFLKLRTSKAAHPQMRDLADKIKSILVKLCPVVFERE